MSKYSEAREIFVGLVQKFDLPMPRVDPNLPDDPCDVTDAGYVRLHCDAAEGMASSEHARHVFGHWLCDLHGAESYEEPTRDGFVGVSDQVADAIAVMLKVFCE